MTRYENKGQQLKISDMPFLVPYARVEFCAHSDIFILFMRQSVKTQLSPIFRNRGNSEIEIGTNEIFPIHCPFTFTQ